MIRRALPFATLCLLAASGAHGQIIQPRFNRTPSAWASLGIAWLSQQGFCDRDTSDCYDFGSGAQWRASLEFPIDRGTSFGVSGTTARLPLVYTGSALSSTSCARCDADANVTQIFGVLHMGGGTGFHQAIDLSGGVTLFSNFRRTDSGAQLGTGNTSQRFTFAVGYGFGYGFSQNAQIVFETEYGVIILPRQTGYANNTAQQYTIRIGGRYGLGGG